MSGFDAAIERIGRRLLTLVGRGRKTSGVDSGNVQMLQVKLGDNELRDNTPRLAEFGFTSMPPNGADLLVLFIGGDRSNGVIVATGDIATRMKNLQPGESAIYDSLGKHVYLKADQIEISAANQPINVINATTVTVNASNSVTINTPTSTVNGSAIVNGNTTMNGSLTVTGLITGQGGLGISGGSGATVTGNMTITNGVLTV